MNYVNYVHYIKCNYRTKECRTSFASLFTKSAIHSEGITYDSVNLCAVTPVDANFLNPIETINTNFVLSTCIRVLLSNSPHLVNHYLYSEL